MLTTIFVARCVCAIILFTGAVYILVTNPKQEGWGWLLFIGLLVTPSIDDSWFKITFNNGDKKPEQTTSQK